MGSFGRRHKSEFDLEARLRREGPTPRPGLTKNIAVRVRQEGRNRTYHVFSRVSFASALTVAMLGALASFGGLSYAASSATNVINVVKKVTAPQKSHATIAANSAASAQYGLLKVTMCHKGTTVRVNATLVHSRAAHGDSVGPCGAVLGAKATKHSRGKVAGAVHATATKGSLPFTGLALGSTMLVALMLVGLGLAFRRLAKSRVRNDD